MNTFEEKIRLHFQKNFQKEPQFFIKAPGRINLIGEHTDYNLGFALPAAIDKHILFGFTPNPTSSTFRLIALDMEDNFHGNVNQIEKSEKNWANYLLGVMKSFEDRGILLQGFDCVFCGNIPIGGGLSSSAAMECGFAKGLDQMLHSKLDNWEIVKIGQETENDFLGVQSGILDQFSSTFGLADQAMLLDCQDRKFEYVNANFGEYELVLINSKVKHNHSDSGYNDRPKECQEAIAAIQKRYPNIHSLRAVSQNVLAECETEMSNKHFRRAQFILHENARVHAFCEAFKKSDFTALGRILYKSHFGLQYFYDVSCVELDLLVDLTRSEKAVLGARMMGGGFGGCTLNLIQKDQSKAVAGRIMEAYYQKTKVNPEAYFVSIENGVGVI
jgi:galactokinase